LEIRVNRHCLFLAAVAAASVAACAAVDQPRTTSAEDKPEKVYTTGSRIPVRDRSGGAADVRSVDGKSAADIMDKKDIVVPGKGGGM
jgi:hypothetical protein